MEALGSRTSRRRFLTDTGIAGGLLIAAPATAGARRRRRRTVAVLGGGVAGLTAAHELIERGFAVTVYERRAWGGKARSMPVPGTGTGGRRDLPAEHGFREIFAGYQNLPDTMGRIPFGSNPNGVRDNLIVTPTAALAREGRDMPFMFPTLQARPPVTPAEGLSTLSAVLQWLPPDDLAQFVHRFAMFLASGDKRRAGEWEYVSWADYMGEATLSAGGRRILIDFATRFAAAMRGHTASAKTIGKAAESVVYMPLTGRGTNDVLDLPTCEAWIDPWVILLRRLGVRLRLGHTVTRLHMDGGRVIGAHARGPRGPVRIEADYFVVALPVERARRLWSRPVLAADPGLARTRNLGTGWMTGLQFYLREPFPIARGALVCLDSPWSVFGISQSQFWPARDLARDYGDGEVREKFSAIICDWETPGVVYGKPARDCTDAEIAHDAFEQIKRHLQYPGAPELRDDLLHSTYLDPGIIRRDGKIVANLDPLLLNTVGHWDDRPTADTAIGNLFLAGDYVRVDFDITSMEGANEAARRAVGALLAEAGSSATPPTVFARQLPDEWAALRRVDDARYAAGQPHLLEAGLEALGRLTGSELRQRAGV